jgi:hypothetical protein
MLNDTATIMDEDLFAATIILRVLEEMDGEYRQARPYCYSYF